MDTANRTKKLVEIGVVGKPHGIRGGVNLYLHNAGTDLLGYVDRLSLGTDSNVTPIRIEKLQPSPRGCVAFFEGITERESAESLKGSKLWVRREDLPRSEPDEFYVEDLIGLRVVCDDVELGKIVSSTRQADIEVITVESESEHIQVPLVEEYVKRLDIAEAVLILRRVDAMFREKRRGRN